MGLPEARIPIEGGRGSALLGISITSLSLLIMGLTALFPQTRAESMILAIITASCLLGTGAIILTLVCDYALILSSLSIYLLLLYWRLRMLESTWLFVLSIFAFSLAIMSHSIRRARGKRIRKNKAAP